MSKPSPDAVYLGDGLYINLRPYCGDIHVMAYDGLKIYNEIFLGPYELDHMIRWLLATPEYAPRVISLVQAKTDQFR